MRMPRLLSNAAMVLAVVLFLTPALSDAQEVRRETTPQGLKRMTVDDYALWRSVGQTSLSPDGRWATYAYSQREVDDSLFIKPLGGGEAHVVVRGGNPEFSGDSRWVAYYVNPEDSEGGSGRAGGGAPPGGPGARGQGGGGGQARVLELYDLQNGNTVRWENVQGFGFSESGSALAVKKGKADSDAEHDGTDLLLRYLASGEEELIAYVDEWAFDENGRWLAYTLDTPEGESNGVHLLDLSTRGRQVLDAEREVKYARLTWGDEKRSASADALAVLKGGEDEDLVETVNALLLWPAVSESTTPVALDPRPVEEEADSSSEGAGGNDSNRDGASDLQERVPDAFPEGWVLSEKGAMTWAKDADRIFVATRPQLPAPKTLCKAADENGQRRGARGDSASAGEGPSSAGNDSADAKPKISTMASRFAEDGRPLGPEEVMDGICPDFMADVDIWHVNDERLQSVQMIRASRDRNQTYTSVVHLEGSGSDASARFVQLTDETMEAIQISDNGRFAMGRNDKPYRSDWEPSYADYYLVDLDTGQRTPVLEGHLRTLGFSPDGKHYLYWKDENVWSYRTETSEHLNLTEEFPVSLVNEEYDHLGEKPPHGVAGWTMDSTAVLLRHRYDLYLQPLDGGEPVNLTIGQGARDEVQFRILDLDPEEELTDLSGPLTLTGYGQWTKKAGFFRLEDPGSANATLRELVWEDARFGRPAKADSAEVALFTREDFETFPDYHVTGLDFQNPVQITDANPQQAEFNWGRRILFDYETHDGVRLQGTLAIPYDYVEGEKRPMLVNYYEKNSQNLHSYPTPISRDTPMFAEYVSAGYLVMQPDIHFRIGRTHSEMLECINLAIDQVEEMGYVDPERIGLHGHSFSGQGSAYIATHSDRFAAIVAGAAATNLISDFNQLWKSSGTNQHGYDTYGQGRFGTSPYDDLDLFLEQSATPNAGDMNTPLLILHGTADGSVEWLQAVEFYNGLRWHEKENVILMSYPGEPHHLRVYENQRDFQIRMRQFYDHWLRDKPAARWMESGRSFLQKERDRAMVEQNGNGNGRGNRIGGGGD
ncbi:MAG: prolyl oligopeptidase family serine peptidase [Gemmatimonadota bacterium]|jgi:dipeptidyl aminopeptidase/acylaminoacyl peptidase